MSQHYFFFTSGVFIFHQDLVLMILELDPCTKPYIQVSIILNAVKVWTLVANPCRKILSLALRNQALSSGIRLSHQKIKKNY